MRVVFDIKLQAVNVQPHCFAFTGDVHKRVFETTHFMLGKRIKHGKACCINGAIPTSSEVVNCPTQWSRRCSCQMSACGPGDMDARAMTVPDGNSYTTRAAKEQQRGQKNAHLTHRVCMSIYIYICVCTCMCICLGGCSGVHAICLDGDDDPPVVLQEERGIVSDDAGLVWLGDVSKDNINHANEHAVPGVA